MPEYSVIIDAGSSKSSIYIYRTEGTETSKIFPLAGHEIYGPARTEPNEGGMCHDSLFVPFFDVPPGIQTLLGKGQTAMNNYLGPICRAAQNFTNAELPGQQLPIYLFATGGMRPLHRHDRIRVLKMARNLIQTFPFNAGTPDTNTRVIDGDLEGLFAWIALNTGLPEHPAREEHPTHGLAEMGGASIQFTFAVAEYANNPIQYDVSLNRVCLPAEQKHLVYSATWNGYGANAMRARLPNRLRWDDGSTDTKVNPCLPEGYVVPATPATQTPKMIGTGNFASCLSIARQLLRESATKPTRTPIPHHVEISDVTPNFVGVASYMYTYSAINERSGGNLPLVFSPDTFKAAAAQECTRQTTEADGADTRIQERCFNAAWMLMVLGNEHYGFGWKPERGSFSIPTPELAERSSWTRGLAILLAKYGGVKYCPDDDEAALAHAYEALTFGEELPAIGPLEVQPGLPGLDHADNDIASQLATDPFKLPDLCAHVNVIGYGLVVLALLLFLVRRVRSRSASQGIRLPTHTDDGDMKGMHL